MRRPVAKPRAAAAVDEVGLRLRAIAVTGAVGLAFLAVGGQLVRLAAVNSGVTLQSNISESVPQSFSRPDLVDRKGRLFATDVENPSLFADPGVIIDRDEVVEKLTQVLPGLNARELRRDLSDRNKRFVWIKRQIAPNLAQKVHDLGLPGVSFRTELKRAYPLSRLAGHVLGAVNVDNKGVSGMERYLDDSGSVEAVHGATLSERAPVRLSIDIGVQHSLTEELQDATKRYKAEAATGVVMDVATGEILASASLPEPDPRLGSAADTQQTDRITGGTYELGSIFKMLTVAESLDEGVSTLDTIYDVRQPLVEGRFTIKDLHPLGRPASVRDIFLHSSNVGAAMIALKSGGDKQKAFLTKLGLLDQGRTEAGPIAHPQVPQAVGTHRADHDRLRPWRRRCSVAIRGCGGSSGQRRRTGAPDVPARAQRRAEDTRGQRGDEPADQRVDASQRDGPGRHGQARRGSGLSRRRQDRHGRDGGRRRLCGEVRDLVVRRGVSHGEAAVRRDGDAVQAAGDRGDQERDHGGHERRADGGAHHCAGGSVAWRATRAGTGGWGGDAGAGAGELTFASAPHIKHLTAQLEDAGIPSPRTSRRED